MTKKKLRFKKVTSIFATLAILLAFVSVVPTTVNASENPSDSYEIESQNDNGEQESPLIGDVNRDGVISVVDATLVRKYLTRLITFDSYDDIIIADVNNDGYISTKDATGIQKMIVGLPV